MAVVGNLGSLITFEVSSDKVLTFDKMKRTVKGRWATHDAIGGKTKSEFLGAGNASITLPIFLSSMHGVRPRVTLEQDCRCCRERGILSTCNWREIGRKE